MCDKIKKDLIEELKNAVAEILGDTCSVSLCPIRKNNVVKNGLVIGEPNAVSRPIVYIDEGIERIRRGFSSLEESAAEIAQAYRECEDERTYMGNIVCGLDKRTILEKVTYRLVGRDQNSDMLADVLHRELLDLAVIYAVELTDKYTITLEQPMCNRFRISQEELETAARKNTKAKGFEVRLMADIIKEHILKELVDNDMRETEASALIDDFQDSAGSIPMWVLTNQSKLHGASILLYPEYFAAIAGEQNDDLYIMPSSIHELIAVAASGTDPNGLLGIVTEINYKDVSPEEVLSDSVYIYRRKTGTIEIAFAE